MDMSLLKPLSKILNGSINKILSGEQIKDENIKDKADENIVNMTELYDLKSSKSGVLAFSGMTLFLLIYCGKRNINTIPIVMIWWVYNLVYSYNKHKFTRDRKDLIIVLFYGVGLIITTLLFFIKTF